MAKHNHTGVSLAKGPVALVGLALLAYGITAFLFGGHSFDAHPISGIVNGKTWLGLEVNAWSSLLFIGAGALLLLGSPLHWGAKSLSMIVALALGAASLIALYDKDDVLGIFAANNMTKLVWGAAAILLLILALLPRVGGKKQHDHADAEHARATRRRDHQPRAGERQPIGGRANAVTRTTRAADDVSRRGREGGSVVTPERDHARSGDTSRRQRDRAL